MSTSSTGSSCGLGDFTSLLKPTVYRCRHRDSEGEVTCQIPAFQWHPTGVWFGSRVPACPIWVRCKPQNPNSNNPTGRGLVPWCHLCRALIHSRSQGYSKEEDRHGLKGPLSMVAVLNQGPLAKSRDIFGCPNLGGGAIGIGWAEPRGATLHPTRHRPAPLPPS